ncbi:MAG: PQQ-binding-like beta-propeller repeat protein [Desulfosalsimonadaceae bacterium]
MKLIVKITVIAGLLGLIWAPGIFSASLNFKASDQHVVKGEDEVVFTFTYNPEGGTPPDSLKIELDYDEGTLYSETFTDLDGSTFKTEYSTVFEQPGYFEVEARFTIETKDADGNTHTDSQSIGPVEINVANWKFTAGGSLGCIESTPVVSADGETVFVGSEDGNLYAVDTQDGTEKWRFHTNEQVDSAPAIGAEGNIYFGSADGHIYCVEPEAGALVWQFPAGGQGAKGSFYASPALDIETGRIYIGSTDHHLYALNMADGSLEWRFKTGSKIVSSPVIGHDHTVYQGSLDEYLYALNPDGTKKWRFKAAYEIRAAPALDADGTIFVGTCSARGEANENNGLHAVSFAGRKQWFIGKINGFPSAPVIAKNGTIIIGSYDNRLYGISRSGGGLNMYKTFDDDVLGSPALDSRGYLYAGGRDGTFYAMDPDEGNQHEGRDEYWNYNLSMSLEGSSPVVQDGYVYIGACQYKRGALYSLISSAYDWQTEAGPAPDAPWAQARNKSANTGKPITRRIPLPRLSPQRIPPPA